jgi:hypothetical protein
MTETGRQLADTDYSLDWLLASDEPAVWYLARRDVLGERVEPDDEAIRAGPIVSMLLSGQEPGGCFGGHPYKKWTGAHWRLVSLVELGVPAGHSPALAAAETVLDGLTGKGTGAGSRRSTGSCAAARRRKGTRLRSVRV